MKIFLISLSLCIMFFCLSRSAYPVIIWQIGTMDDSCNEFNYCGDIFPFEQRELSYIVPSNWELLVDQDPEAKVWDNFIPSLYPYNDTADYPQELSINYLYPTDYTNLVLRISASTARSGIKQYLEVYRGSTTSEETFIDRELIDSPFFSSVDFSISAINRADEELNSENIVIIRNIPDPNSENNQTWPLIIDALSLDNYYSDSDEDGVIDSEEGDADWDEDGDLDKEDHDTVCIPIKSEDTSVIKRITLDIDESEAGNSSFKEVGLLDPNTLNLPKYLKTNRYVPYGFLGFKIEEVSQQQEGIFVEFISEDTLYSSLQIYVYNGFDDWQVLPFEFVDSTRITISLKDGGAEDSDTKEDECITTILTFSYPPTMGIKLEKGSCFLEVISEKD